MGALNTILASAESIPDILSVRDRMTQVQSEINRLQGQINVLADKSSYSAIAVTLAEKPVATAAKASTPPTGLSKAWKDARDGFSNSLEWIIARSGGALIVLPRGAAAVCSVLYFRSCACCCSYRRRIGGARTVLARHSALDPAGNGLPMRATTRRVENSVIVKLVASSVRARTNALAALRMAGQCSVSKSESIGLVDRVHDATRRQRVHRPDACGDDDVGARLERRVAWMTSTPPRGVPAKYAALRRRVEHVTLTSAEEVARE